MMKKCVCVAACLVGMLLSKPGVARDEQPFIVLASTTSTENSGLFDYILPEFKRDSGIPLKQPP